MPLTNDKHKLICGFNIRTMPKVIRQSLKVEAGMQATSMEKLAIRYISEGLARDKGIEKGGK